MVGDNFCYLCICDIIKDKAKPSSIIPSKREEKKIKRFTTTTPPTKN